MDEDSTLETIETATLAAGCFWCIEAVFQRVKGVHKVVSGYSGGVTVNPSYNEVCSGNTGHAESVQITFDPKVITFAELLDVFWVIHDPTTLNCQGADVGTQYRSAIFFHDTRQKETAEQSVREAEAVRVWPDPIVTEIVPFKSFYQAESYHQDYYRHNQQQPYCRIVIGPKIRKLQGNFSAMLKGDEGA
jgi:peptide-methionine (S)-S-oxide reductase